MKSLLIAMYFSFVLLQAQDMDVESYERKSRAALEMAQYHPDKARLMHEKIALQLEAELEGLKEAPAHLAYNLGNLWYHAGELGRSLMWYRKAQKALPYSSMIEHNIGVVLKERLDQLPKSHRPAWLPYGEWLMILETPFFLSGYAAWVVLLWHVVKWTKKQQVNWTLPLGVFALTLSLWLFVLWLSSLRADAVILDSEVVARKGNGLIFAPAFTYPLHEATEVRVLEERSSWVLIQLSNGEYGWVPKRSIGWLNQ